MKLLVFSILGFMGSFVKFYMIIDLLDFGFKYLENRYYFGIKRLI